MTLNNLTGWTIQDASSSQDTLISGVNSSAVCDPGYVNGPPSSGQCSKVAFTPFTTDTWGGLTLQATNSRAILASIGGVINPEIICADTNTFGLPIWGGGNQAGCGYQGQSRTGAGVPVIFNISNNGAQPTSITASIATGAGNGKMTVSAQSGAPIVFGETFVGAGFTTLTITGTSTTGSGNCSPACTGAGGTGTYAVSQNSIIGSEAMVGGRSGAEGSMQVGIYGGSLQGLRRTSSHSSTRLSRRRGIQVPAARLLVRGLAK